MDVFDTRDELIRQKEHRLQGELAVAEVEKILQARSEKVENHGIVVTFGAKPPDEGDADTSSKGLVDASFILQLRMLGLDALEFDGNLFTRDDIGA